MIIDLLLPGSTANFRTFRRGGLQYLPGHTFRVFEKETSTFLKKIK